MVNHQLGSHDGQSVPQAIETHSEMISKAGMTNRETGIPNVHIEEDPETMRLYIEAMLNFSGKRNAESPQEQLAREKESLSFLMSLLVVSCTWVYVDGIPKGASGSQNTVRIVLPALYSPEFALN